MISLNQFGCLALICLASLEIAFAFSHPSSPSPNQPTTESVSRRNFGNLVLRNLGIAASTVATLTQPAMAKDTYADDKQKILTGYSRLNYLLDNWEKETTFCGTEVDPFTGKTKCERTPLKIMDYMGYKSTTDPLFKAEKTLRRLEPLAPSSKETDYFDAVEKWAQVADEASGVRTLQKGVSQVR